MSRILYLCINDQTRFGKNPTPSEKVAIKLAEFGHTVVAYTVAPLIPPPETPNTFVMKKFPVIEEEGSFDVAYCVNVMGIPNVLHARNDGIAKRAVAQILDIPKWRIPEEGLTDHSKGWGSRFYMMSQVDGLVMNDEVSRQNAIVYMTRLNLLEVEDENKLRTVLYGIDTDMADSVSEQPIRNQVICAARLVQHKRQDLLVKPLSLIPARVRPELVLVGSGGLGDVCVRLGRDMGVSVRVLRGISDEMKFTEIKRSLFGVYSQLTPDIRGLFPGEAMACHKTCVAWDYPILRHAYGYNIQYVQPNDTEAMSRAIYGLIIHPEQRDRLGRDGYDLVKDSLSLETHARGIELCLTIH